MKNASRILSIALSFLIVTVFCSPAQAKSENSFELNFANFYSAKHEVSGVMEKWAAEVGKRTGGKIKVTFYHGASLAKMPETYDMIKTGSVEAGSWLPTYQAAIFPVSSAVNIPFTFEGPKQGGPAMWEFFQKSSEMQKEYSEVKLLMLFTSDIKNIHTGKKPVHSLADLKGQRIGCGAGMDVHILTLLGATPVQTRSLSDQYLALQRGTSDGIYYPWAVLKSLQMMPHLKYHTVLGMGILPVAVAMNLKQWNRLPDDVKKVFDELSLSTSALCGLTLEEYGESVKKELKDQGNEFYIVPEDQKTQWKEILKPLTDQWAKTVQEKGMDSEKILRDLKQAADKYKDSPYSPDPWWGN